MCKREGCEKPVRAKGYCINHYSTWYQAEKKAAGYETTRSLQGNWTKADYEDYWNWVVKELKIVQK